MLLRLAAGHICIWFSRALAGVGGGSKEDITHRIQSNISASLKLPDKNVSEGPSSYCMVFSWAVHVLMQVPYLNTGTF